MNLYLNCVRNPGQLADFPQLRSSWAVRRPYDQLYRDRDYVGIAISRTLWGLP
ncbi:hypothetical protein ACPA9J_17900 [Pseudomonas aeruginosa]